MRGRSSRAVAQEFRCVDGEERNRGSTSFAQWAGLYVSGLLLVAFVAAHLWAVHYSGELSARGFTFANVSQKMRNPVVVFFDLGLLVLALFHGLVGTHRFIADLSVCGQRGLRVAAAVLTVFGVLGSVYGWLIYRAFAS